MLLGYRRSGALVGVASVCVVVCIQACRKVLRREQTEIRVAFSTHEHSMGLLAVAAGGVLRDAISRLHRPFGSAAVGLKSLLWTVRVLPVLISVNQRTLDKSRLLHKCIGWSILAGEAVPRVVASVGERRCRRDRVAAGNGGHGGGALLMHVLDAC